MHRAQRIEAEVNVHWRELLVAGAEDALLTLQLRRMTMCMDICCDATLTDDQRAYVLCCAHALGGCFAARSRWEGLPGADRCLERLLACHSAFVFDAATGANRVR